MTYLELTRYQIFFGYSSQARVRKNFHLLSKVCRRLMKKFKIFDCKSVEMPTSTSMKLSKNHDKKKFYETHYKSLIGSLIYLTNLRLDIVYAINIVFTFMVNSSKDHFAIAKKILRYIEHKEFWHLT